MVLRSDLTSSDLEKCEKTIRKFIKKFENLYGEKYMVYNVHLLMHLVESVRNFGPAWSYALFPYENFNGILKSFVKGPKEPILQINSKFLFNHFVFFNNNNNCRSDIKSFCEAMLRSGSKSNSLSESITKYPLTF